MKQILESSSTIPSGFFFHDMEKKKGIMITVRKGKKIPLMEEKKEKNRVLWKNAVAHLLHKNRIYGKSVAGDVWHTGGDRPRAFGWPRAFS